MLINRFTDESEASVARGVSRSTRASRGTPEEVAEKKTYRNAEGELYVPGENIMAALVQAGTFFKVGKAKLTSAKGSIVPAAIIMETLECPLGTKTFVVDSRRVVNPATGGAMMAYRPRIDAWKATFALTLDESILDEGAARELVETAGSKVGLCDFRPAKKGPFGRFKVIDWQVLPA